LTWARHSVTTCSSRGSARADLFSLGIVLYEMATGERPFKGDTSISVLSAILRDTPKSVTELRAELPRELSRIVRRCVQKDAEQRYQTAKDVRDDLQLVKADLGSGEVTSGEATTRPPVRRKSWRTGIAVGAGAIVLAVLAAVVAWRFRPAFLGAPARTFESIRLKQLTDTGKVYMGAISPDGRYIVYSMVDGDSSRQSLWLRQAATGSDVQIIPPGERRYFDMTCSPDGNFVYDTNLTGPGTGALYQIPALGGAERRVLDDVVWVSVSPDGARLAVVRSNVAARESSILVANPDGTGERRLVTRKRPDDYQNVSWAPDGRLVYTSFAGGSEDVWSMKSDGSQPRQPTFDPGPDMGPAVSTGGRFIVFFSDRSGKRTLWRMDIDGGNARQLTSVRGSWLPVLTPDGTWVVYSQVDPGTGFVTNWKVPVDGGESVPLFKSAAQPTDSGATAPPANFRALVISADGRWVAGGHMEANRFARRFVLVSAEGTEPRRELNSMPSTTDPIWVRGTRDGSALLYVRTERGVSNLWLQPLDGSAPRQLTSFASGEIDSFALSDDGRTLAVSRGEATTDLVMITSDDKR